MKRTYKIGEKYVVDSGNKKGNVIEITAVYGNRVQFKVVKEIHRDYNLEFSIGSIFEYRLKPVKKDCIVIYQKDQEVIALNKAIFSFVPAKPKSSSKSNSDK